MLEIFTKEKVMARKSRIKRIINIPQEYFEVIEYGNLLFPILFQLENGLRLSIYKHLETCYGKDWWNIKLKSELNDIFIYSEEQSKKKDSMPWIGDSTKIKVLPIHLVTLGQLEEIIKKYRSDCIPEIFPTIEFFLGHMEVIKRVRNMFSHMFPCITKNDCQNAKSEIKILATHINSKLKI